MIEIDYTVRKYDCGEPLPDKYSFHTKDLEKAKAEKEKFLAIDRRYWARIFKTTVEEIE